jgi:hypothetical protein
MEREDAVNNASLVVTRVNSRQPACRHRCLLCGGIHVVAGYSEAVIGDCRAIVFHVSHQAAIVATIYAHSPYLPSLIPTDIHHVPPRQITHIARPSLGDVAACRGTKDAGDVAGQAEWSETVSRGCFRRSDRGLILFADRRVSNAE